MKIPSECGLACALFLSTFVSWSMPSAHAQSSQADQTAAERSTMLTVTVAGASRQFTMTDLAKLPQTTMAVHNAHTNREESYSGVSVAELFAAAGLVDTKQTQGMILRSYVRAQGTDFYFVIYSGAELQPAMSTSSVIVATRQDGRPLQAEGEFKLVGSADKRPARWVRNLHSLTLVPLN